MYIGSLVSDVLFCNEKLLVNCPQGLELVDVTTYKTQALLDPQDIEPLFLERPVKQPPTSIFVIEKDLFLLCFQEYGFFIDKTGKRVGPTTIFEWLGKPHSFVYCFPYVFAFDGKFIEIWNASEAILVLVVPFTAQKLLSHEWPLLGFTEEAFEVERGGGHELEDGQGNGRHIIWRSKIVFVDQA